MALESVTHLDDLEVANPLGTDPRSQGDDHIRNIKVALKTDFPNITAAVTATAADLNLTSGLTAGTVIASKIVLVDSSKKVNEWLVDNVTIDGNSITSTSGDLQLKAVSGSNLTIQDDADAAKEVTLVMSSVTSGQDRAWTFPDSDGTFIGAATTETLTNKTIDAGEFTTDLNLNDSVPLRMGTAEDSSISFDGTDLIILTDGAGASGIILDSEDNTVEIKGSGVLQATFDAGGIDLASGDAYEINDTVVLNATTLGSAVVASSLTSTGALNGGSITSGFGSIVNGASAITTTGTVTGGVVVADNLTLDANAITSTDTNGDITITPHGTGSVVLDGVNWPQADGSANTYLKTNGSAQTSWVAGSPAAAVLTTHGDLVFQNSAPANARLAAGTDGQFLKTQGSGADPVWATISHTPADNSVTAPKIDLSLVAGDTIHGTGSDTWARLPKGDDGQVYTLASGVPSWTTPASGGGLVFIAEVNVTSGDAAASFLTSFSSTYDDYIVYFDNMQVAVDTAIGSVRIAIGGAAKTDSTYAYGQSGLSEGGGEVYGANTASALYRLSAGSWGNQATEVGAGWVTFHGVNAAVQKHLNSFTSFIDSNTTYVGSYGGSGYQGATTAWSGCQFLANGGNLISGNFKLFGIKNS
jgi:hypothetical protein